MLTRLIQDLRYGLRVLIAKPGFASAAILTLALGIGANTLVFTLIDGVYLNPLPYRDAGALIDVYATEAKADGNQDNVSIPDYLDLHNGVAAFADSALYTNANFNLVDAGVPERLQGLRATASLFSTLGANAALGRVFGKDEALAGQDHVVVLSDAYWRNRFNADPHMIGRSLRLDGEDYRVIGVMARDFMFPATEVGLFVPFVFAPAQVSDDQRGVNYSFVLARLAPGATAAQAEAQAAAIVARNIERIGASGSDGARYAHNVQEAGFRFGTRPLREQLSGRNAGELVMLQVAVSLVLLIVLANVGNLLLTRLSARRGELAVRTALGARRIDVVRQLMTEAALLAGIGGAFGVGLAWLGVKAVRSSSLLPAWATFAIDARTVAFALGTTALACCAFGVAPMWLAARAQQSALRESSRIAGSGQGTRRLRHSLVVVQVALAISLLAGVGLLLRSFANAAAQNPGFNSENLLTAKLSLPQAKYPDDAARARVLRRLLDSVQAQAGVDAVAATTRLPFGGENGGLLFRIPGKDLAQQPHAALRGIDENYFSTMGIPLLRGRSFNAADWDAKAHSVVVDAAFEQRYFPGGDAVGQNILLGESGASDLYTIVGVVGSVKHFDLTLPARKPTFYFDLGAQPSDSVYLVVRGDVRSAALAAALRAAVQAVDPEQPLFNIASLQQRLATSLTGRRVPLQLLGLFAVCALLLAAIGIYGVLAFGVEQRTTEIGLRMAIGADAARVRRGVLADGARLVGAGAAVGVLSAVVIGFLLKSRLFDVAPVDPLSLGAVIGVLALTAFAACWLPAHRASRLNPIVALRHE